MSERETSDPGDSPVSDYDYCSRCGSSHISNRSSFWCRFFTWIFVGVPLAHRRRRWVCLDCGHRLIGERARIPGED